MDGVVLNASSATASTIPCVDGNRSMTFAHISNLEETYSWLKFVLQESQLFTGEASGTERGPSVSVQASSSSTAVQRQVPLIMPDEAFVPVGAIRLRQLRVKQEPCTNSKSEQSEQKCNLPYDEVNLNKDPFQGPISGRAYEFQEESTLARSTVVSEGRNLILDAKKITSNLRFAGIFYVYPASGFVIDIQGGNRSAASAHFEELRADRWLDDSTVALFVSFAAYSLNLDTYVYQTFLIELNPYGVTATTAETRPFKLVTNAETESTTEVLELVLMLFSSLLLAYLLFFHLVPLVRKGSLIQLFFGWAMYDTLNLSLVIVSVAIRMNLRTNQEAALVTDESTLISLMSDGRDVFVSDFDAYSRVLLQSQMISAWSLIICFLKFFKFMDMDKRFSIALTSMVESGTWLAGWLVFTVVSVLGLTLFCKFAYGYYSLRFSSFAESLTSVLLFTLQVFGEGFAAFAEADYVATPSQSTLSFVALRYGATSVPLSLPVFQILDTEYSIPFVQGLFFAFVFATVVIILITNMFQAILIFGYQKVAEQVQEEEDLRREQHAALQRSQRFRREGWLQRYIKMELSELYLVSKQGKILNQLKSVPEARARNLLSFPEVQRIVAEAIPNRRRAGEVAVELMSLYSTTLSRIDDAAVLFKDREIALREDRLDDELDASELPVLDATRGLEIAQTDRWQRDMQSGELIQSMVMVHSLQLESSSRRFREQLDDLAQTEREIRELAIGVENALQELQAREVDNMGDVFISRDPWDPRASSGVEARIDGAFDAHHVADGRHTYLGSFPTRLAAQNAIDEANSEIGRRSARATSSQRVGTPRGAQEESDTSVRIARTDNLEESEYGSLYESDGDEI
ncbi:Polycystin-2 [Hondaea fermentalgiana]|uniref:Polycystin-2 n=1 Tax=Hondaea fermentalgiana TaxID=2315210 RepID=A0A2R5GR15_9STRA|nr:Polycystin-2 [Hondaea fermentalgiana]|eukprot:GBG33035.1 Polycystin-2 [Hondaea fermentalgiana]